jgi:hypothetical protein
MLRICQYMDVHAAQIVAICRKEGLWGLTAVEVEIRLGDRIHFNFGHREDMIFSV